MNARSVRLIAAAFAFCGLLEATQLKVIADGWSFTPSLDGGPHLFEYHHDESDYSHLSETAPAVPHPRDTQYSITLHNPTNVAIAYAINDQPEQRIKPGVSVKWSVMGYKDNPAQFNIRFDSRDNKQISYHLENNMPFDFYLKDDRLDLTNRRKFFQIENSAFERLEAGKWTEKSRDGREFRFRELGENKDFVELFDDSRQLKLRLYKNVGKIYNEQERQWRAWRGSEGSWK